MEWLPVALRRCLMSHVASVLGRMSPEGRMMSRALRQWVVRCEESKENRQKANSAVTMMSPEGRAKGRSFRAWFAFAKHRREQMGKVQQFVKRMSPEGRLMHAGMQGFKSRTPAWLEGPDRVVSSDGFWVVSTLHKERESAIATPEIQRGLFRFGQQSPLLLHLELDLQLFRFGLPLLPKLFFHKSASLRLRLHGDAVVLRALRVLLSDPRGVVSFG